MRGFKIRNMWNGKILPIPNFISTYQKIMKLIKKDLLKVIF